MSSNPQSKPKGDEDVIETFSLQERRRVEPDPVSQKDAMDHTIRKQVEIVAQEGVALPSPAPQSQVAGGSGDSTEEMNTLLAQMRSELSSVRAEVEKVRADANSRTTDTQRDTDRANERTTPRNEDTQRDTDRANEITQRDTDRADERTTPRNEDTQRDTDRANELVGKGKDDENEDESEGEKDGKASGRERTTSSDGMPVSLDVRGKIYIPEVTPFEIWDEISKLSSGQSKLSLKCTVTNLEITSHEFVDEFTIGTIDEMVEFDGGSPPQQISFTLPLAERIFGQGNTWLVCTQGGVYTTPIYCVDGKPAIFPTKHT